MYRFSGASFCAALDSFCFVFSSVLQSQWLNHEAFHWPLQEVNLITSISLTWNDIQKYTYLCPRLKSSINGKQRTFHYKNSSKRKDVMFWPGQKKTQKQVLVALVILSVICSMFYGWHQMSKFKWSNLSYVKFIFEQPGKCEIKCYCNLKIIVNTNFFARFREPHNY